MGVWQCMQQGDITGKMPLSWGAARFSCLCILAMSSTSMFLFILATALYFVYLPVIRDANSQIDATEATNAVQIRSDVRRRT